MPLSDFLNVEWSPSTLPADTPSWEDITASVESIVIDKGRDDELDVYASGKMTLVIDNGDTSGKPRVLDLDTFYRQRRVRIEQILFTGWVNDVTHDLTKSPTKATATVTVDDLMSVIAQAELTGDWSDYAPFAVDNQYIFADTVGNDDGIVNRHGLKSGTSDYVAAVIARLNLAFSVDAVGNAHMPLWIPTEQTGNLLQIVQRYLEAELGWWGVYNNTTVIYAGRWFPFYYGHPTDPSYLTATFSDTPTGFGEFGYLKDSVEWANVSDTYANSVTCQSIDNDSIPRSAEDIPTGFLRDSMPTRDQQPVIDENWMQANADLLLSLRKQTNTYPRRIKVLVWAEGLDPSSSPASNARLGDFHKVLVTMPGGVQTTYRCFVERIRHEIRHDRWYCTFEYTSADRWFNAYPDGFTSGLFTLDDATFGLDSGAIIAP